MSLERSFTTHSNSDAPPQYTEPISSSPFPKEVQVPPSPTHSRFSLFDPTPNRRGKPLTTTTTEHPWSTPPSLIYFPLRSLQIALSLYSPGLFLYSLFHSHLHHHPFFFFDLTPSNLTLMGIYISMGWIPIMLSMILLPLFLGSVVKKYFLPSRPCLKERRVNGNGGTGEGGKRSSMMTLLFVMCMVECLLGVFAIGSGVAGIWNTADVGCEFLVLDPGSIASGSGIGNDTSNDVATKAHPSRISDYTFDSDEFKHSSIINHTANNINIDNSYNNTDRATILFDDKEQMRCLAWKAIPSILVSLGILLLATGSIMGKVCRTRSRLGYCDGASRWGGGTAEGEGEKRECTNTATCGDPIGGRFWDVEMGAGEKFGSVHF